MKVVLGTDGSDHSAFAEQFLLRYPLGADAVVDCCSAYSAAHILTATSHPFLGPVLSDQIALVVDGAKAAANRFAAESAKRLKAAGVNAHGILLEGDSSDALSKYANAQHAAFVAVGSRGLGTIETLLLGSVARDLANDKDISLLVTRAKEFAGPRGLRVVFATDHSEFADRVAAKLPSLVSGKFESIEAVSVFDPDSREMLYALPKEKSGGSFADLEKGMHEWLEETTAKTAAGFSAIADSVSHTVMTGHAREELLKTNCDLIIMGARGRSGISRLLLGSVSHYVVTRAECSVMIIRA